MLKFLRNKKAQNTAEYALLIALVIAAAIAMQTYIQRSMQGGIRFAVDKLKKGGVNATGQYEPYYLQSDYNTTTKGYTDRDQMYQGGKVERFYGSAAAPKQTIRSGDQTYLNTTTAD